MRESTEIRSPRRFAPALRAISDLSGARGNLDPKRGDATARREGAVPVAGDFPRARFERKARGTNARKDIAGKLEAELERLKRLLGLGHHLRVKWAPNNNGKLAGEVKGDRIYIYEGEEKRALETLRHEFLDHAVSQTIEPYKDIANRLILIMNEDAYRRKEKLVERLSQLIKE